MSPSGTPETAVELPDWWPVLQWSGPAEGVTYTVQVVCLPVPPTKCTPASRLSFTATTQNTSFSAWPDPATTPPAKLPFWGGRLYKWYVYVRDDASGAVSERSEYGYFRTKGPARPEVRSPGNPDEEEPEQIHNLTPTVHWKDVAGADGYSITMTEGLPALRQYVPLLGCGPGSKPDGSICFLGNVTEFQIRAGSIQPGVQYNYVIDAYDSRGIPVKGTDPNYGYFGEQSDVQHFIVTPPAPAPSLGDRLAALNRIGMAPVALLALAVASSSLALGINRHVRERGPQPQTPAGSSAAGSDSSSPTETENPPPADDRA